MMLELCEEFQDVNANVYGNGYGIQGKTICTWSEV